ncbi:hypothetical protein V6N11_012209 [Hibiscus sabdariffa]|uniref:Uncharacterized protein n=1 Tax=Hibiscus sabdariffa TaxID=183260 RepID=A0ABR2QAD3_9ROSI
MFCASPAAPYSPLLDSPTQYKPFLPFQWFGKLGFGIPSSFSRRQNSCHCHLEPDICGPLEARAEDDCVKGMRFSVIEHHFITSYA